MRAERNFEPYTQPADEAGLWTDIIRDQGYAIIPNAIAEPDLAEIEAELAPKFEATAFCEGRFYGSRTKRFGQVLNHSRKTERLIRHALVLDIVERILAPACDCIQLNLTQALEVHPGAPVQVPHRDHDMWPVDKAGNEYLVNVMWPFIDYRRENGATWVWPGSHRILDKRVLPEEDGVSCEMDRGSVLIYLGGTLHRAGANVTDEVRRGLIVSYNLGWLKPWENQMLVYPPAIASSFGPELAALVGYRQHRPTLGNVDGLCPSTLLTPEPQAPSGYVDAMTPEQDQRMIDYYTRMGLSVPK